MNRWTTILVAGGTVVLAVVLFVLLRPDGDGGEPTPAARTTAADDETTAETPTEEGETEEAEGPSGPQRVVVEVRSGQPVGGVHRPEVERDSRVLLIVRSDVADEAHLHGYDLFAEVAPGREGRITFRADLAGRFELELEQSGVLVAELEVR